MLAELTLIGRVGRDAELRYTPSGTPVASFSLATSKKKKGADGKPQDVTTWFRISAWGQIGEFVSQYCLKGAVVAVQGELDCDPATGGPKLFKRADGSASAAFDVVAAKIRMVKFVNDVNEAEEEVPF